MRMYYDWEFFEDGKTIEPISIGIAAEDGSTYYAVFENAPMEKMVRDPFHKRHIIPYLPTQVEMSRPGVQELRPKIKLNVLHSDIKPEGKIANEVYHFMTKDGRTPELWAYYAAYDHVRLAQLFGRMIDMPSMLPKRTNDIAQEAARLGLDIGDLPDQKANVHKAIDDALWNREAHEFLIEYAKKNGRT